MATATRQILIAEDLGQEHPVAITFFEAHPVNDSVQLRTFEDEFRAIAQEYQKPVILNFSGVENVLADLFQTLCSLQRIYILRLCCLSEALKSKMKECNLRDQLIVKDNVAAAEDTISKISLRKTS